MTAVQITEYTYTATRKYHDFDQSATTADDPDCYDTLQEYLDAIQAGTASTGIKVSSFKFTAQKQLIELSRVTGTAPVGKYTVLGSTHIPDSTEIKAGTRTNVVNFSHLTKFNAVLNDDFAEELGEGFETAHPVNGTKNNISVEGTDTIFKSSGTALTATGKIRVDNSYSKLTFDKDVVLADAQAAAAAADTQMNNYDIFTQEA